MSQSTIESTQLDKSPQKPSLPKLSQHAEPIAIETAESMVNIYHNPSMDKQMSDLLSQTQHTQRQLAFLKTRVETQQAVSADLQTHQIPLLLSKTQELEHIFIRIDRLYALVSAFEDVCDEFEQRCDQIEKVQGSTSMRRKIGSLFKSMVSSSSPSSQASSSSSSSGDGSASTTKGEAKMPTTANTEELLPNVAHYMNAP